MQNYELLMERIIKGCCALNFNRLKHKNLLVLWIDFFKCTVNNLTIAFAIIKCYFLNDRLVEKCKS